jgi:hypothetical protein
VLYAGGGRFVALFRSAAWAKTFVRTLSSRVIQDAPGLHVIYHSIDYNWNKKALSVEVGHLLNELKAQRSQQPLNIGLAGLGVTVMCDSTSMPAVDFQFNQDNVLKPYSAEVLAKRRFSVHANDKLKNDLALQTRFRYPLDFDDLGRTEGEKSYIAVVLCRRQRHGAYCRRHR